jgi:chemosensory pili system protein ChpA (sensor histidine kinase/response regulator)
MKNILVIDDDHIFRYLLCQSLMKMNFHVTEAANSFMGLQLAKEHYSNLNLIICDVDMPKLDGYSIFNELRKTFKITQVPFIFLTGSEKYESHKKAVEMGGKYYLTKSLDLYKILHIICTYLSTQN